MKILSSLLFTLDVMQLIQTEDVYDWVHNRQKASPKNSLLSKLVNLVPIPKSAKTELLLIKPEHQISLKGIKSLKLSDNSTSYF